MSAGIAAMVDQKAMLADAGIGFALVLIDYGDGGIAYASSGKREDMREVLRELLEKMDMEAEAEAIGERRNDG